MFKKMFFFYVVGGKETLKKKKRKKVNMKKLKKKKNEKKFPFVSVRVCLYFSITMTSVFLLSHTFLPFFVFLGLTSF